MFGQRLTRWRLLPFLAVLALTGAACGGNGDESSEDTLSSTTSTTVDEAPWSTATTPPPADPTTSTAAADDGGGDCTELWPESAVTDIAGAGVSLVNTNVDMSACLFGQGTASITLSFRPGDAADLEIAKSGAALVSEVTDLDLCDGAWMTALQDTIIIVEVLDASAGRVYNGTLAPRDNVEQVAMALTSYPCN